MKLIHRIGYYLGGFSIGLVILAFFLNGKKASCSYGPESRVLKNINAKKIVFSDLLRSELLEKEIDSNIVSGILKKGDVNFSKSNTRTKPCGIYVIEGSYGEKPVSVTVENCDSVTNIVSVKFD